MSSFSTKEETGSSSSVPQREPSSARSRLPRYLLVIGAALVVASVVVVLIPTSANAAELTRPPVTLAAGGSSAPNTLVNPLVSQQPIDVVVGPNSKMDRQSLEAAGYPSGAVVLKVLECADPGGSAANLPTKPSECEPETIKTIPGAQGDGSLVVKDYFVLSLPNVAALGTESATTCDMQHQCVLGIFTNQNDYTKPHLFSAAFNVAPASGSGGILGSGSGSSSGTNGSGSGSAASGNANGTGSGNSSGGSGHSGQPGATTNSTVAPGATVSQGGGSLTGVSPLFFGLLISGLLLLLLGTVLWWVRRRNA